MPSIWYIFISIYISLHFDLFIDEYTHIYNAHKIIIINNINL